MFIIRFIMLLVAATLLYAVLNYLAPSTASAEPDGWIVNGYEAPGHHHFHEWYQMVQKKLGIDSCCDDKSRDCGPVEEYTISVDGIISVQLEDGKWHPINTSVRIIYIDTPDGKAHACREPDRDDFSKVLLDTFTFHCLFMPIPELY